MSQNQDARAPRLWPLYLGGALGPFGGGMINVILPEIADSLDTSVMQAGLAISAYLLPFSALLLMSGTLGTRWGLARTAKIGFIAYAIGTLLCILAPTIVPFLVGRAIQGISNAFTSPLLIAIILEHVTLGRRGRALGLYASLQAAGYALAPLAGGLAAQADFRLAFIASGVFALLIAALIRTKRLKTAEAVEPPSFKALVNPGLGLAALIALCAQFGASAVVVLAGLVADDRFELSSTDRGLVVAGFGAAGLLAGHAIGALADRIGVRWVGVPMIVLGGMSAGTCALAPNLTLLVVATWIGGLASAGGRVLFISLALTSTPTNPAGATSIAMASQFIGTAAVPALIPLYAVSVNPVAAITTAVGLLGAALAIIGTRTPASRPQETVKELACPKSAQTLPLPSPNTSQTG